LTTHNSALTSVPLRYLALSTATISTDS